MQTKLSVNINKIATIRNARGGNTPNVELSAIDCERFGAHGITIHPRPDERHITTKDTYDLAKVVKTELNIEGYPDQRFMAMVAEIKPAQATLVPDPPHVLTSNAGWDTEKHLDELSNIIAEIKSHGVRTSIFVDTELKNIEYAAKTGDGTWQDRTDSGLIWVMSFARSIHMWLHRLRRYCNDWVPSDPLLLTFIPFTFRKNNENGIRLGRPHSRRAARSTSHRHPGFGAGFHAESRQRTGPR
jgi:hypothetical protein